MNAQTTAVIVAGGQSRRLGEDKRRLRLWGRQGPTLLEHTLQLVGRLCADVVVVLNDAAEWPGLAARTVPDVYADGGALGGIYAGLRASPHEYALVVAADMPLLNEALLAAMLARPRCYDLLVPRSPQAARNPLGVEPLHAIYSTRCLAPIQRALDAGRRQITAFFPDVQVAHFELDDIQRYDLQGASFLSINTAEQLAEARRLLAGESYRKNK
jgi:molybdopterin-guanine dinucleotide biosynthesis protein A